MRRRQPTESVEDGNPHRLAEDDRRDRCENRGVSDAGRRSAPAWTSASGPRCPAPGPARAGRPWSTCRSRCRRRRRRRSPNRRVAPSPAGRSQICDVPAPRLGRRLVGHRRGRCRRRCPAARAWPVTVLPDDRVVSITVLVAPATFDSADAVSPTPTGEGTLKAYPPGRDRREHRLESVQVLGDDRGHGSASSRLGASRQHDHRPERQP